MYFRLIFGSMNLIDISLRLDEHSLDSPYEINV